MLNDLKASAGFVSHCMVVVWEGSIVALNVHRKTLETPLGLAYRHEFPLVFSWLSLQLSHKASLKFII